MPIRQEIARDDGRNAQIGQAAPNETTGKGQEPNRQHPGVFALRGPGREPRQVHVLEDKDAAVVGLEFVDLATKDFGPDVFAEELDGFELLGGDSCFRRRRAGSRRGPRLAKGESFREAIADAVAEAFHLGRGPFGGDREGLFGGFAGLCGGTACVVEHFCDEGFEEGLGDLFGAGGARHGELICWLVD